jgi:hypothetical protein
LPIILHLSRLFGRLLPLLDGFFFSFASPDVSLSAVCGRDNASLADGGDAGNTTG